VLALGPRVVSAGSQHAGELESGLRSLVRDAALVEQVGGVLERRARRLQPAVSGRRAPAREEGRRPERSCPGELGDRPELLRGGRRPWHVARDRPSPDEQLERRHPGERVGVADAPEEPVRPLDREPRVALVECDRSLDEACVEALSRLGQKRSRLVTSTLAPSELRQAHEATGRLAGHRC
jgi:hypothetical protein